MAASRSSPSADPAAAVEATLGRWFAPGDSVCVALSGGRDSCVLLDLAQVAARRRRLEISALHVHHGLSPNADRWADFCARLCARSAIPFHRADVSVRPEPGEGLEAAARRARYAAFADIAGSSLLLAHHAGDQAETLLFRLTRGTALAGAAAMAEERLLPRPGRPALRLLRPLLAVPSESIAAYAAAHAIEHVEDESNGDHRFSRNFLRHEILPPLEARFPGAALRLAGAAARFREAAELLDDLARIDEEACAGELGLALPAFRALTPMRRRNLLAYRLRRAGPGVPSTAWLDELCGQLAGASPESQIECDIGDTSIRVWRNQVVFVAASVQERGAEVVWRGEHEVPWCGGRIRFLPAVGEGIAIDRLQAVPASFRSRQGGERLRPDPRRPTRSLKNLLREAGLPPWQRQQVPLLWCGDRLAWAGGIGVDAAFAAGEGEPGWTISWP